MRLGFLFSGQGAQYPGMGKSLYEYSPAAKKALDEAGEQIQQWCFDGTKEQLRQTQITQPCIYTVSMAAYGAFWEAVTSWDNDLQAFEVAGVAGFSLGEYTALTAAGIISSIRNGLDLVAQRGKLMMEAGADADGNSGGGMIAALGKRDKILACVESAREDGILEGVNFNSAVQTVVAGDLKSLERFKEKAAGNRIKAIPLSVSAAFHSPMMHAAAQPLQTLLSQMTMHMPKFKIYANSTGRDMFEGIDLDEGQVSASVARIMAKQVETPVYWQETIENMEKDGIETVIEFGPGNTLCGLVKKIAPNLTVLNVEDVESLNKTKEAMAQMLGREGKRNA